MFHGTETCPGSALDVHRVQACPGSVQLKVQIGLRGKGMGCGLRYAPDQRFGLEGAGLGDKAAGSLNLIPDVPQEHSADLAGPQIVDDAFLIRLAPVSD
jgi:hypothetical protein